MKWISVIDKAPAKDEVVLAFTNIGDIIIAIYSDKWREVVSYVDFRDEIEGCGIFVSHWMPLPQSPEVK
ncbi:DUF551 domain-containing protein [Photorhabdus temperata]|uniref:DUF551 domain-containing protein n=1 Tax=Photorhabdus temperata subsp. temperata Meg1 TaxID=1393735 RepID=A0A081RQW2_PHOTE|nr:DUF551 domain-containing protein [Photorhabdus temperata]KER01065.1 Protein of unknown function (DUF551) [Photorhabdus temperata subsp. temperata Meg1]